MKFLKKVQASSDIKEYLDEMKKETEDKDVKDYLDVMKKQSETKASFKQKVEAKYNIMEKIKKGLKKLKEAAPKIAMGFIAAVIAFNAMTGTAKAGNLKDFQKRTSNMAMEMEKYLEEGDEGHDYTVKGITNSNGTAIFTFTDKENPDSKSYTVTVNKGTLNRVTVGEGSGDDNWYLKDAAEMMYDNFEKALDDAHKGYSADKNLGGQHKWKTTTGL